MEPPQRDVKKEKKEKKEVKKEKEKEKEKEKPVFRIVIGKHTVSFQ